MRAVVLAVVAMAVPYTVTAAYTAYWCQHSDCSQCDTYVFGEDVCESSPNELTAIGECESSGGSEVLYLRLWTTSGCSGSAYLSSHIPQGTCAFVSGLGPYNYIQPFCTNNVAAIAAMRNQSAGQKALPLPRNTTREGRPAPLANRTLAR